MHSGTTGLYIFNTQIPKIFILPFSLLNFNFSTIYLIGRNLHNFQNIQSVLIINYNIYCMCKYILKLKPSQLVLKCQNLTDIYSAVKGMRWLADAPQWSHNFISQKSWYEHLIIFILNINLGCTCIHILVHITTCIVISAYNSFTINQYITTNGHWSRIKAKDFGPCNCLVNINFHNNKLKSLIILYTDTIYRTLRTLERLYKKYSFEYWPLKYFKNVSRPLKQHNVTMQSSQFK